MSSVSDLGAAALLLSIMALIVAIVSAAFTGANWKLNRDAQRSKAPKFDGVLGLSAKGLLMFDPLPSRHQLSSNSVQVMKLGVRVHNPGERPFEVASVQFWASAEGDWSRPTARGGVLPDSGPDLPHVVGDGSATWELELSRLQWLPSLRSQAAAVDVAVRFILGSGEACEVGPVTLSFPTG